MNELNLTSIGDFAQDEEKSLCEARAVTPGVYYPNKKTFHRYHSYSPRQKTKRVISKNGEFHIDKSNYSYNFFSHMFIKLVECRWRWTLLSFCLAFTADWLLFGLIYWTICFAHGDLDEDHLPNGNDTNWKPCIRNIYGLTSTFLISIEIHTTLAYGRRAVTLECAEAILAMCFQCIVSSIFQALMVGILFAKFTRPKSRTNTMLFSKNAVICLRDQKLCLIFKVGDMRKSRILNIQASMYVIRLNTNYEKVGNSDQIKLNVFMDGCESTFFLWPLSVIHVINEDSPLYHLSAADLLCGKIEILAVFEGIIESTGQPVQARSSYIENEILWGHRFVSVVSYCDEKELYNVNFSKLSETEQVDTPLCSAFEFESVVSEISSYSNDSN